jgi:hypothetical protein
MAKLQSETIVIQISRMLKNTDDETPILTEDYISSLEAVVQELAGSGALVEINVE